MVRQKLQPVVVGTAGPCRGLWGSTGSDSGTVANRSLAFHCDLKRPQAVVMMWSVLKSIPRGSLFEWRFEFSEGILNGYMMAKMAVPALKKTNLHRFCFHQKK